MQDRLLFVISPPRAGSTLLQRMLGSHSAIYTHPEPHIITPLAHLGFYDNVDKAPYDHINAAEAIREYVGHLPVASKTTSRPAGPTPTCCMDGSSTSKRARR
jgi:hypothetical protein